MISKLAWATHREPALKNKTLFLTKKQCLKQGILVRHTQNSPQRWTGHSHSLPSGENACNSCPVPALLWCIGCVKVNSLSFKFITLEVEMTYRRT